MNRTRPPHLLERIVARSFDRPLTTTAQYGFSAGLVLAVGLARALLITDLLPWLLFIPAILGIALITGKRPGLLAVALATVLGSASMAGSHDPVRLSGPEWASSILFAMVTTVLVLMTGALRSSMQQARSLNIHLAEREAELSERGAFLASVLASSTDCIKVLDLDGRLTFMSEGGRKVMEVSDFNQIASCPWPDFWRGTGNNSATAALEEARAGRSSTFMGHAETMAGNGRWWHVAVSPILGPDGRPERILSVSRDVSTLRSSEEQRDRYARLIENSSDLIGMARLDGRIFFLNQAGYRLVGLAPEKIGEVRVSDFFPPDQVAYITSLILPAARQTGSWTGERMFRHFETGELIPVLYTVFPVQDADGEVIGYGTVTRDFRDRKAIEAQQEILNGEIAHRLKNTLAMVQSIASMTLRKALPPDELARFNERLQALARAHDLLHQGRWRASDLADLARGVIDNLGLLERCRLSGPPVQLGARAAMSTSLLLHELCTNAIKYGAWSVAEGTVEVSWQTLEDGSGEQLALVWHERDGPPAVAGSRKGFGSRLISLGLVGTGGADVRYEESGLEATFRASMKQMEQA